MAIDTTTVANTIRPYFNKKLLEGAKQLVTMLDYAQLEDLPDKEGATSVRFFKAPEPDLKAQGAPAALTEGIPPTVYRDVTYTTLDVNLVQRGQVAKATDIATTTALFNHLKQVIELMQGEFALDVDTILRNQCIHPTAGLMKRYAQGATSFAALAAATRANGRIVPRDVLDAATRLKINRAPKFGNKAYACQLPPQLTRDILEDPDWKSLIKSQYADKFFKGEVGEISGVRLVEQTNPFVELDTEGTESANPVDDGTGNGLIYSAIVCGKQAYGAVNMNSMGASPHKPQIVIVDKPDSGNPLAQFILVGWKAFWASTVLQKRWGITLRTKSQFIG
ncbi:N4-gp56 family major capsid protein [Geminisphaera colitermitum]|uniref:N4-gp56 family major capsid protein n=1 Tax=Geminisphaera colitermitum TaxID=1148786 RepID=UPI000158CDBE|nr:N4-gp56 family major capsid protein [Geminisphaera colitermitum]